MKDGAGSLTRFLPAQHAEFALQVLDEQEAENLACFAAEIAKVTAASVSAPLASTDEAHRLNELLSRGAAAEKNLEFLRTQRVKPLNEEVRSINALFKLVTAPLEEFVAKAKRALLAWMQQERARVQREEEESRRRQEEAAVKEAEAMAKATAAASAEARSRALAEAHQASIEQSLALVSAPAMQAPKGYRGDAGSSSMTERWVLLGIHNLAEVPLSYWRHPDVIAALEKVLRAAIRSGAHAIPGVSIGTEEGIAVRAGR